MDYLKDPAEIYRLSAQRVRATIGADSCDALVRMVHACADPLIAEDFRCSDNAESFGQDALQAGATILCDCMMVQQGIIASRLHGNRLICTLNASETRTIAQRMQTTRSAAAVTLWQPDLEGSIVVIGNAPTALFQLLEMLAAGAPKPALIIGMPVGFVGAAESKQALDSESYGVPYMTLLGRKGGSAIAAAALNSLAGGLGS